MKTGTKSSHLQLRISPDMKRKICSSAHQAGMDMSEWILMRLFPQQADELGKLIAMLREEKTRKLAYAELNDFLTRLAPLEFTQVLETMPVLEHLPALDQNYIAAMVELAAHQKGVKAPAWIHRIAPLPDPYYGVPFATLRLYLLVNSPIPFKRRNIFIDASLGDRV